MPSIERPGATVYYETSGEGPAIILGHSLLCDGRMWEGVVPALAEHHRVVNVDFRGHRHSTAERPYRLEELADDWLAIMDAEKIDRAVLCGLSMGAMAAMRLALAAPDRVRALVLIDSNADTETRINRVQYRLMAEVYRRFGLIRPLEPKIARLMFSSTTLSERPELVRRFFDRNRDHQRQALYNAVLAVIRRGSVTDRLGAIDHPALVIVGSDDRATPPAYSTRLHRGLPNSRLVTIEGAGHLSAAEEPEQVAGHILQFLQAI